MLPASSSRTAARAPASSRPRSSCRSTTYDAHTAMPGVQMPHWAPPHATSCFWTACSTSPLAGLHAPAIRLACRDEARVDDLAVEQHRARTALALAATFLRAGEAAVLAQHVEQSLPRRALDGARLAVHFHRDLHRHLRRASS